MGYDLRKYLQDLRGMGERVVEVKEEVDWNLEAAAFAAMIAETAGPVVLFENIKGYAENFRLLAGLYTGTWENPHRRFSAAMGMDPNVSYGEWAREAVIRQQRLLKPIEVAAGPCKEVIKMGKDVNLYELPWPYYAEGDGGRYSLSQAIVCKDPDSDWTNWANYAVTIHSRNRAAIAALVGSQLSALYHAKYEARGDSMPVCIAIGGDPLGFLVSGMPAPEGVSEADIAGALRGAPMELVRAETNDLLVPADAEVVIEGEIRPGERLPEGPKSEAFQFQAGPRKPTYALRVTCITHRKDPILPILVQNYMGDAQSFYTCMLPMLYWPIRHVLGLPIKGSAYLPHRVGDITISTKVHYPTYVRELRDKVYTIGALTHWDHVIAVDDDLDPNNYEHVLEAMWTQVNPRRDIHTTDNDQGKAIIAGSYLDDVDLERQAVGTSATSAKQFIDCTSKSDRAVRRHCFETVFPEETQQWVVDNWARLGFQEKPKWYKPYMDLPAVGP